MKATREMWLVLRARDEATSTLRRAARGIGGLSDPAVLQRQRSQIAQQVATAKRLQEGHQAAIQRLETGSRQAGIEKKINNISQQRLGLQSQLGELRAKQLRILSEEEHAQTRISRLMRFQAERQKLGLAPQTVRRNFTAAELAGEISARQTGVAALTESYAASETGLKRNAMATNALKLSRRQVKEQQKEMLGQIERENKAFAEQAMRIQNLSMRDAELAQAMQRMPIENWQIMGNAIRNVARSMVFLGGVATLTLGVMASKAAEFSKQLALATTQARQPGEGPSRVAQIHGKLFDEVTSQMQEFPASAQEMSDSLYQIFSSTSVKNIDIAGKMLRTFNMMAVAGGTDLKTMTDAGISLFNNFGSEFPSMTEAGNRFFAAVKVGRMNAEQFAGSLSYLLPIAKEAGLTFDDVGGSMAFLTRQTGAARTKQDAQGLARLIQLLGRTDVAAGLATRGVQVFGQGGKGHMRPILDIMEDINSHIHLTNQEMLNFFKTISAAGGKGGTQGTIQAIRIFAQYQASIHSAAQVQREFMADQNEMIASFNQMSKDPGVRWEVFQNQLRALALIIGTDLIPLFARLGSWVARVARWFSGLSQSQKRLIADFIFFGSVATLVIGLLGTLAGAVILIRTNFVIMRGALAGAGLSLKMFRSESGATMVQVSKFLGVLSALLILLPLLAKLTGSWGAAFAILGTAISVISFVKMFAMIAKTITALESLAVLASAPYLISFTFVAVGAELIARDIEKLQNSYLDAESRVVDLTTKPQQSFIDYLGKEINKLKLAGETSAEILAKLDKRLGGGLQAKDLEAAAFQRSSELRKPRAQRLEETMSGAARKGPGMIPIHFSDAEFLKEMKLIIRLRQEIEKAPDYKAVVAATKAARREEERAARASSDVQKAMQEDVIQRILDGQINALVNTKGYAKQISEEYFKLQKQFAVAPTMNLSTRIETLKTKFEQLTPAQQSFYTQMYADLGIGDKAAMQAFTHLRELQAQFKVAPTLAIAKEIQRYQKVLDQASPAQKAFFDQLTQSLGEVKVITDKQALGMAERADKLKKAFDKSPSAAGWNTWYTVQKQFTTMATSDQQSFANDMVSANTAATNKMKENFDSVLNFVRQKYDEIRSTLQSAFGTIGSGPVVSKLNAQVTRIRDSGNKQAQALRDQATKIKDSFDDAQDTVSAATGNLIDWGLLPKPADMSKQVDAQVKALNDQADAIEKAAGENADALQKRLDEHRLTPKEILGDLKAQVKAFLTWNNDLEAISKRGAPKALMDQLRALGPEFDNMLKGIRKMSPDQFNDYVNTFNKAQKVIDKQAMKQLKDQLKQYQQHGADIAQAIADGITSNDKALRAALVKLIEETFPGIQVPGGGKEQKGVKTPQGRQTAGVSHNTTVHYHYHAGQGGMTPQTYFQKMHFRQRNQRRC